MEWEAVIGLEVHTQLATRSKIFSGAATAYGAAPNTQACAVDLGLPGVLPVINERVIEMAVMFGLAIGARIAPKSRFARKNYFYPDLPKGYQISQYEDPIVAHGQLEVWLDDEPRLIEITRAHLEEDAGKSVHGEIPGLTGIDLNRAGTPLLEIVSEPVMHSAREAVAYMRELHRLVRYLKICDGNMQEGSFRCDANVSVRPRGTSELGTRTEIKNINSFRFVERAIDHEIERQIDILENGGSITQETRLYDPDKDETRTMRTKEDAHDYRYFPDPDLLPVEVPEAYILDIAQRMPELPAAKLTRYTETLELGKTEAQAIVNDPETAAYFEACLEAAAATKGADKSTSTSKADPKQLANWIAGELFGALNKANLDITQSPIAPTDLSALVARITDGTLSGKIAKQVFQAMWTGEGSPDDIINKKGLRQVSDTAVIEVAVNNVIAEYPAQVEEFKAGKEKILAFLVGQVMKRTKGQANPGVVNEVLRGKIV
ncbi:MAG: Asp-tRNA(Asn)/Glu-tRNA(Gln) amidotransferase subunit GatB [Gammaproteobacteria bacterium]